MNQKILATLRAIGYPALFAAISALMSTLSSSTYLNGTIALFVTAFGAILEHQLAMKLGYNLPSDQIAVSATTTNQPSVGGQVSN